jgi:hypothetical protein
MAHPPNSPESHAFLPLGIYRNGVWDVVCGVDKTQKLNHTDLVGYQTSHSIMDSWQYPTLSSR